MKICKLSTFRKFKKTGLIPDDTNYFHFAFIIPLHLWFDKVIYDITGIDINNR